MAVYKITPTKANLMKVESMLALMESSYTLLDKKRVVLLRAANKEKRRLAELEEEMGNILSRLEHQLSHATVALGHHQIEAIAAGMPVDHEVSVQHRSYMGVDVVRFHHGEMEEAEFEAVHITLDFARDSMQAFKMVLLEYAAVSDAAVRLEREMLKTQKRANALDKVQIPKYKRFKTDISQALEEKEREEFFRLKLLKKKKTKKRAASPSER